MQSNQFCPINKILFWSFLSISFLLTWIGARPVEDPYIITGQILTVLYFAYFPILFAVSKTWGKIMFKS